MENQKITYRKCGDYYIPNLSLPKVENITLNKYGRARLKFLKENKKAEYTIMFMDGILNKHLKEIQETATKRIELIVEQLRNQNNLTEEIKNTDQLYWVTLINVYTNIMSISVASIGFVLPQNRRLCRKGNKIPFNPYFNKYKI